MIRPPRSVPSGSGRDGGFTRVFLTRGRGVILQRYRDGGLSDVKAFRLTEGLSWFAGAGRTRTETDLTAWIGRRAQAGRLPPTGFPRTNKFGS